MIKIYIDNYNEISNWYCKEIIPIIDSQKQIFIHDLNKMFRESNGCSKLLHCFLSYANNINDEYLVDVLTLSVDSLVRKYRFIKSYVMLVEKFITNKKKYLTKNEMFMRKLNETVNSLFDYDLIPSKVKQELVHKLNIRVCPYCNRQYIQPISVAGKKLYYNDLDHIWPKSRYPLFSMSLWNLLPSCKPCNQYFKRSKNFKILSPYDGGFEDDAIFKIIYNDLKSMVGLSENMQFVWRINANINPERKKLIEKNIELFHLNDLYECNKREIMNILRKRYVISKSYEKSLSRLKFGGESFDEKLYYGVSLNPKEFQNELLGKAIYDILFYDNCSEI